MAMGFVLNNVTGKINYLINLLYKVSKLNSADLKVEKWLSFSFGLGLEDRNGFEPRGEK